MAKSCSYVHLSLKKLDVVSRNDLVVDSLYCNLSSSELGHSNCSPTPYSQFRSSQLYLFSPHCPVSSRDLVVFLTLPQVQFSLSQGSLHVLHSFFCHFSSLIRFLSSSIGIFSSSIGVFSSCIGVFSSSIGFFSSLIGVSRLSLKYLSSCVGTFYLLILLFCSPLKSILFDSKLLFSDSRFLKLLFQSSHSVIHVAL